MAANQDQEMWLWKFEPASPNGGLSSKADDDWLLLDDKSVDFINNAAEPVLYDDHPTRAQVATKLLEELDEWIKEEPFSDWLEEKIELPIFEELPVPNCVTPTKPNPNLIIDYSDSLKIDDQESTQTLLQEFETVLGDVEACHQILPPNSSTLTPPQSPPPNPSLDTTQLLVTLQPVESLFHQQQTVTYATIDSQEKPTLYTEQEIPSQWNAENVSLVPLGNDVTNELADVVDEFVRCYSEDVSPPSPCTSSDSCHLSEDSTDDPDWVLEREPKAKQTSRDSAKHRYKPYSRSSLEDKKVRKKEQNKNAATRYRQKKKQEIKEIIGEEQELTEHNEKLKNQVKDLQREIGYLKGLMKDLFKAKGLIK